MRNIMKFVIAIIMLLSCFVIAFAAGDDSPGHILKVSGIAEQTENKGDLLVIRNFKEGLSGNVSGKIINFYMNLNKNSMVICFEKVGEVKMFFAQGILLSNSETGEFAANLSIPIPQELENGKYNVRAHQINDIWSYRFSGCAELVFEFELNVTDADPENIRPFKLNKLTCFKDNTPSLITDGNGDARPVGTLNEQVTLGLGNIEGYALDENGWVYGLGATGAGTALTVTEGIAELPAGRYECYFCISGELYGPLELGISELIFAEKYYPSSSQEQVTINLGKIAQKKIPAGKENFILSMNFKNPDGETVHNICGIEVIDFSETNFGCELNFAGIAPGLYDVEVMLDGIKLGSGEMCITDKTIITDATVLHYGDTLTTATKSFYVKLTTPNIFLGYEKIDINLLTHEGDVVAKTVSKEPAEISLQGGSTLIYKLDVTGVLDDSYRFDERYGYNYYYYTLDIQSQEDADLIFNIDKLNLLVTQKPRVVRTCFIDKNTATVYTENVGPGEYTIVDLGDNNRVYDIIIDEQGEGVFGLANIDRAEGVFELKSAENVVTDFTIRMENEKEYFSTNPGFILAGCPLNKRFFLSGVYSEDEIPTAEGIEYARFVQVGETIAAMSNFEMVNVSYSDGEPGSRIDFYGDIMLLPGKNFAVGKAMFEIKYKSGSLYTNTVVVTDEQTGLFGSMKLDNSGKLGGHKCTYAVGDNKLSFEFEKTNITEGKIILYDDSATIEVLDLAELEKTAWSGWYSYSGIFNTELSEGGLYGIKVISNGITEDYGGVVYYNGKRAEQTEKLTAFNGKCLIALEQLINVSDTQRLTFKAVMGSEIYHLPVIENYASGNGNKYLVDFSSVPAGYFCVQVYDYADKIHLGGIVSGYNFGNLNIPKVTDATWRWADEETREYGVSGINLDKTQELSLKIYKYIDFPEIGYDDNKRKLEFVKDIIVDGPYNENYLEVTPQILSEFETGGYLIVYLLDGKTVISQEIYIKQKEPVYDANVVIGTGEEVPDNPFLEITISYSGYTKMKIAFSEKELESAEYQPILPLTIISAEGKNGLITVFVRFANDNETKIKIIRKTVTVKIKEPVINNVNIPHLKLWENLEITFSSNKLLKSAVIVIGKGSNETDTFEGENYKFSLKGKADDDYIYTYTLYVDSRYKNWTDLKAQIVVCDETGNEVKTDIIPLQFSDSCNISGRVMADGMGIAYMEIYLYNENRKLIQYTYTNDNGEYTFADITKGNYVIEAITKGYEPVALAVNKDEFESDITGKDFNLKPAFFDRSLLTIVVKDYSGKAMEDVRLCVYSPDYSVNITGITDESGVAIITVPYSMEESVYSVYASYKNYAEIKNVTVNSENQMVEINFLRKAQIRGAIMVAGKKVKFVFTRPVNPDRINNETFKVFDAEGVEIPGEILLAENNKVLLFKPKAELADGDYKAVASGIKDTENNDVPQTEIPFKKQTGIDALDYPDILYNAGILTITFPEGKIPINEEEIVIEFLETVIPGTLHKSDNVITFIPYDPFMSGTRYTVKISEKIRTAGNEYFAEDFHGIFVTPGIPGPLISAGTSGGNTSVVKQQDNVKTERLSFKDIAGYEWAHEAIAALARCGIIKGVSEDEFAPDRNIKRADCVLLLIRLFGLGADVTENFDDVGENEYYYQGVGIAKALELTTGVGDNKFNPEASITRQDMFVLAHRTLKKQKVELGKGGNSSIDLFADYDKIAIYAKDAVAELVLNGLVEGADNRINPESNASRAETAVFIYRLYNLINVKMKLGLEIE